VKKLAALGRYNQSMKDFNGLIHRLNHFVSKQLIVYEWMGRVLYLVKSYCKPIERERSVYVLVITETFNSMKLLNHSSRTLWAFYVYQTQKVT